MIRSDGYSNKPVLYRGENAVEEFLQHLDGEHKVQTILTAADRPSFREAAESAEKHPKADKVREYCLITGNYRGAAHSVCNLKLLIFPDKFTVPEAFHNLQGYDSHQFKQ